MNNNKLDFQELANFALDNWYLWTNHDIEHCVRAMIDEKFPYNYIKYAFNISKNDYYYYLNLEIQERFKANEDYNTIKAELGISDSDYQNVLKATEKMEGDYEV